MEGYEKDITTSYEDLGFQLYSSYRQLRLICAMLEIPQVFSY